MKDGRSFDYHNRCISRETGDRAFLFAAGMLTGMVLFLISGGILS